MKVLILYAFLFILAIALILIGVQILRIQAATKKFSYDNKPLTRNVPHAPLRFLFVGDSTALGVGAQSNTQSVAGWFAADFPQATIENKSANGKRLMELVREFPPFPDEHYDLIVIQIGANDIFRFTSFNSIEVNITTMIKRAKTISKNVVIMHSGNVGLAPIFIWPFDWIMTERTRKMRSLYMRKAYEEGVLYIDLFTERKDDPFLKDIDRYYCLDHLHPSGDGYRWWYKRIRETLDQAGITFDNKEIRI